MKKKRFESIDLNDPSVREALSQIGVSISDYKTNENFSSHIWKVQPKKFTPQDLEEQYMDYIHPEDREKIHRSLNKMLKGESSIIQIIYRLKESEGGYRWVLSVGKAIRNKDDNSISLFVGIDSDISELKDTERKLLESISKEQKRSEELIVLRDIIKEVGSSLDRNETVRQIMRQLKRIIPYESCSLQILSDGYLHVVGGEGFDDEEAIKKLKFPFPQSDSLSTRAIQEHRPFITGNVPKEFPSFIHPNPSRPIYSWMGIPLITSKSVLGLIALDCYSKDHFTKHHLEMAEIVGDHLSIALENAMLHEKAYKLAMEDALTGLGSRHRMEMEGRLIFERAIRKKNVLTIAMLDIDFFKKINDTYGHDKGDEVLKSVSGLIKSQVRGTSLLARFGGEEFVLILPETSGENAYRAVERIRTAVEQFQFEGIEGKITLSGGLYSGIPLPGESINSYIVMADKALYRAKEGGRNQTVRSD
ncbi:MAG: diguanylate cyclase [Spirochaetales bacterium]|nr:diguanylate cyclase [Spirochaetales bacterium]